MVPYANERQATLPAFSFLQLMSLKNGCALISSQHPFLKPILLSTSLARSPSQSNFAF